MVKPDIEECQFNRNVKNPYGYRGSAVYMRADIDPRGLWRNLRAGSRSPYEPIVSYGVLEGCPLNTQPVIGSPNGVLGKRTGRNKCLEGSDD